MLHGRWSKVLALLAIVAMLPGCLGPNDKLWYIGDANLHYYEQEAMKVAQPAVSQPLSEEVELGTEPRTLNDRSKDEIWNLTLAEAVQIALSNAAVIRTRGQFRSAGNSLLANPLNAPSVYDPAIQDTGVLFGTRGVESALAAFDTNFTTSMVWGRNENVQNNAFAGAGVSPGSTLVQETGNFASGLSKSFATGGQLNLTHNWNYLGSSAPGQLFPSSYSGVLGANYRHPLWAGAGTEYTRIAGPITQSFGGLSGVTQGVVIARINNDITIAQFEENVRNLVRDVEDLYWELYLQYRLYDTAVTGRNSVLRSWREAQAKLELGGIQGFKPADEAQARDAYFNARASTETTLGAIYTTETEFRRLLGLPVNDGRIIRPSEEPTTADFEPDWYISLAEALSQRVELRRQKWNIKSLELQLTAAESLTNPRLDFVSGYQVNGFGDRLFGQNDDDGRTQQGFRSGYETITQGNQTGWNLGFQLSMPLGFRQAHAQVRNIELRLAKARKILSAQELDISHELAVTLQNLASQYQVAETNYNRREAAKRRVELFDAELEAGTATIDLVLRAQASLADAEQSYYTSLVRYNQALIDLQFRKGTLLEQNGIQLAESEWTPEAYEDALRRAWARSHATENPLLHTEPPEFALPAFQHHVELPSAGMPMPPGTLPVPADDVPPPAPPANLTPGGESEIPTTREVRFAPGTGRAEVKPAAGYGKPGESGKVRQASFAQSESLFRDGDSRVAPRERLALDAPGDILK